jgi:hypothetical protein
MLGAVGQLKLGEDAMRKRTLWMVAIGIVLGLVGCVDTQPEEKPAGANVPPVTKEEPTDPYKDRLLQIAAEYETYQQPDRGLRLTYVMCAMPQSTPILRLSKSGDGETHGRKLYFMYAKDLWNSRLRDFRGGSYINFPDKTAPVGQVIVKQSWVPEELPPGVTPDFSFVPFQNGLPTGTVKRDGKTYRAVRQGELFVMFKLDPSTPDTDNGWVYGNVSADGKKVLGVGRLETCMKCHQDAAHDRLFGLPEEHPQQVKETRITPWPKDWSNLLGSMVTLEGRAANAKLGALLIGNSTEIWIDGLDSWPNGFYNGGDSGKRLRVTGMVIKRDDMPVLMPGEGATRQGVGVSPGSDLEKAKSRYLLWGAKWTVLE